MSTIPERPNVAPERWISAFWFFDKATTGFGLSQAQAHSSKEEAIAAANNAGSQSGSDIRVLFGYAYPPVGSAEQPYFVNVQ